MNDNPAPANAPANAASHFDAQAAVATILASMDSATAGLTLAQASSIIAMAAGAWMHSAPGPGATLTFRLAGMAEMQHEMQATLIEMMREEEAILRAKADGLPVPQAGASTSAETFRSDAFEAELADMERALAASPLERALAEARNHEQFLQNRRLDVAITTETMPLEARPEPVAASTSGTRAELS